jgi:hypothetical protein
MAAKPKTPSPAPQPGRRERAVAAFRKDPLAVVQWAIIIDAGTDSFLNILALAQAHQQHGARAFLAAGLFDVAEFYFQARNAINRKKGIAPKYGPISFPAYGLMFCIVLGLCANASTVSVAPHSTLVTFFWSYCFAVIGNFFFLVMVIERETRHARGRLDATGTPEPLPGTASGNPAGTPAGTPAATPAGNPAGTPAAGGGAAPANPEPETEAEPDSGNGRKFDPGFFPAVQIPWVGGSDADLWHQQVAAVAEIARLYPDLNKSRGLGAEALRLHAGRSKSKWAIPVLRAARKLIAEQDAAAASEPTAIIGKAAGE